MLAALRDQTWQRSLSREYFYYSFLDEVTKTHPNDAEIRSVVKTALLALLSDPELDLEEHDPEADIDARAMALGSLRPLVEPSDLPRVAPMLDDARLNRTSRWQLRTALSRIAPDDALRERMVPLLADPQLALLAAQSLGRFGHPAALETLVEQGLKRLGHYSSIELDIDSFRPYGADAEQALLSLLDYPNAGTREVVRRFLVEWPSADGRQRLWAGLSEAIDSGRAPAPYTLSGLSMARGKTWSGPSSVWQLNTLKRSTRCPVKTTMDPSQGSSVVRSRPSTRGSTRCRRRRAARACPRRPASGRNPEQADPATLLLGRQVVLTRDRRL